MALTQQLTVTAHLASGADQDVTSLATYESSDPAVATVSSTGLITAVGEGTATITATYQGASDTCAVTVSDPVEGLTVDPPTAELELE